MIVHQPKNSLGNYNYNAFTYTQTQYLPHFHKNFELIYAIEGETALIVDGKNYTMTPGTAALIFSGQVHAFDIPTDASAFVAVFSQEYVSEFASQIKGSCGEHAVFTIPDEVFALFRANMMAKSGTVLMKKACLYAICDAFLSQVKLIKQRDGSQTGMAELLTWVSQHYTEPITLADAAKQFGYEYHYLSRLLNKTYRISFNRLVNGYRVEHATELLQKTDRSITEIVSMSGFQSIRNFNLVFKEITGKTPKDFR